MNHEETRNVEREKGVSTTESTEYTERENGKGEMVMDFKFPCFLCLPWLKYEVLK